MYIQCLVQVPDPWEGVEKRGEGKKMKGVRMGKGKENGEGEGWKEGNEKERFLKGQMILTNFQSVMGERRREGGLL